MLLTVRYRFVEPIPLFLVYTIRQIEAKKGGLILNINIQNTTKQAEN